MRPTSNLGYTPGHIETVAASGSVGWSKSTNASLLAGLCQLVFETILQEHTCSEYRQGGTLGDARKHWFRAKFGSGQLRLFFCYISGAKLIVCAWVNDEDILQTCDA
jgi:toxin YhaV